MSIAYLTRSVHLPRPDLRYDAAILHGVRYFLRVRPKNKKVRAVLRALLDAPDHETHGLAMFRTGTISAGAIYPVMLRLEHAGWVSSRWETFLSADGTRWPWRRYYRLTDLGVTHARAALAQP